MNETLFTRLASYSQNPAKQSLENFTTEVLVHLINNDKVFRRIFIRHIIRDGRIQRRFKYASAESQQSFGNGIVDIVLSACDSRVLVEVKIAAAETETKIYGRGWVSQVQKYLNFKAGRVAYLTTKVVDAPNLKSKPKHFLGQSYFEDLYDHLIKAKPKMTDVGRLFLEFMEENEMKSPEQFNQMDLSAAAHSFDFAKKCEIFLSEIRAEIEPEFRRIFRTRAGLCQAHFSPTYRSAWTIGKLRYGNARWAGISLEPEAGKFVLFVYAKILRTDIKRLNRHLNWTEDGCYLSHAHPVKSDKKSRGYVKLILRDLKQLKGAFDRAY